MAYRDNSGLTACYHVISMLEAQLRSAHDLRERLEAPVISAEHHAHILKGLCGTLLDEAVAAAQAVAMLREQICGHGRNSAAFVRAGKPDTVR